MSQSTSCLNCGGEPAVRAILVYYNTPRKIGPHVMHRAECGCGTISKCRPTVEDAMEAWNEPWQAMVGREWLTVAAERAQ